MSFKILGILMAFVLGGLLLLSKKWAKKQKALSLLEADYGEKLLRFKSHHSQDPNNEQEVISSGLLYWQQKGLSHEKALELIQKQLKS